MVKGTRHYVTIVSFLEASDSVMALDVDIISEGLFHHGTTDSWLL